jgi:hypothetical protein
MTQALNRLYQGKSNSGVFAWYAQEAEEATKRAGTASSAADVVAAQRSWDMANW